MAFLYRRLLGRKPCAQVSVDMMPVRPANSKPPGRSRPATRTIRSSQSSQMCDQEASTTLSSMLPAPAPPTPAPAPSQKPQSIEDVPSMPAEFPAAQTSSLKAATDGSNTAQMCNQESSEAPTAGSKESSAATTAGPNSVQTCDQESSAATMSSCEPGQQEQSFQDVPSMPVAPANVENSCALHIEPQMVLCGRKVLEPIGQGAYGKVYMAIEMQTEKKQVLKVTTRSYKATEEARCLSKLPENPHIIQLFHWTVSKTEVCMFLEYAGFINLEQLQTAEIDKRFQLDVAVDLFSDVHEAVSHLHRHDVCHLDIKPANIMVGDDKVLRLADFGLAESISKPVRHPCGSVPFAAPEVLDAFSEASPYCGDLADCFAMGVLLFELCFGHNSMFKQFGWRLSSRRLLENPQRRAREMRDVLSQRDSWCKEKIDDTQDEFHNQEALLFVLCALLNSKASMRSPLSHLVFPL
eukprot:gnl/MRDRNA2_/MRDRNA2_86609_c0_seq1.p1 gnl/MRDRNA2_/MRDRNA2_86609_c0~~gnl/MRDRNA2_/MRDRNA2_86609_c0_seq1.p1  ORF type:complete len:466 (+),score=81.44 gnl/MRDRNA2_/MRDRNA2_86609_c0_seq1:112-1509(+)